GDAGRLNQPKPRSHDCASITCVSSFQECSLIGHRIDGTAKRSDEQRHSYSDQRVVTERDCTGESPSEKETRTHSSHAADGAQPANRNRARENSNGKDNLEQRVHLPTTWVRF